MSRQFLVFVCLLSARAQDPVSIAVEPNANSRIKMNWSEPFFEQDCANAEQSRIVARIGRYSVGGLSENISGDRYSASLAVDGGMRRCFAFTGVPDSEVYEHTYARATIRITAPDQPLAMGDVRILVPATKPRRYLDPQVRCKNPWAVRTDESGENCVLMLKNPLPETIELMACSWSALTRNGVAALTPCVAEAGGVDAAAKPIMDLAAGAQVRFPVRGRAQSAALPDVVFAMKEDAVHENLQVTFYYRLKNGSPLMMDQVDDLPVVLEPAWWMLAALLGSGCLAGMVVRAVVARHPPASSAAPPRISKRLFEWAALLAALLVVAGAVWVFLLIGGGKLVLFEYVFSPRQVVTVAFLGLVAGISGREGARKVVDTVLGKLNLKPV